MRHDVRDVHGGRLTEGGSDVAVREATRRISASPIWGSAPAALVFFVQPAAGVVEQARLVCTPPS